MKNIATTENQARLALFKIQTKELLALLRSKPATRR